MKKGDKFSETSEEIKSFKTVNWYVLIHQDSVIWSLAYDLYIQLDEVISFDISSCFSICKRCTEGFFVTIWSFLWFYKLFCQFNWGFVQLNPGTPKWTCLAWKLLRSACRGAAFTAPVSFSCLTTRLDGLALIWGAVAQEFCKIFWLCRVLLKEDELELEWPFYHSGSLVQGFEG